MPGWEGVRGGEVAASGVAGTVGGVTQREDDLFGGGFGSKPSGGLFGSSSPLFGTSAQPSAAPREVTPEHDAPPQDAAEASPSPLPIIAATDGSARGNPGPAGWAWYISERSWAAGCAKSATNNAMEFLALADLLEATKHLAHRPLEVRADSRLVIDTITKYRHSWKRNDVAGTGDWRKSDGGVPANLEVIQRIDRLMVGRSVKFVWVKAHKTDGTGDPLNEGADRAAYAAATSVMLGQPCNAGPGYHG